MKFGKQKGDAQGNMIKSCNALWLSRAEYGDEDVREGTVHLIIHGKSNRRWER